MKKGILLLLMITMLGATGMTQNNSDDFNRELDQMMEQMEIFMKDFSQWMGESPFVRDTTIIREFHFPGDELGQMFHHFSPDSLMNSPWFNQMEEQMREWSNQDWSDLERFFEDLEKSLPRWDAPEGQPNGPSDDQAKPKKKKKKVTTL